MCRIFFFFLLFFQICLFANPKNHVVIKGDVSVFEQGKTLKIHTHTDRAIINWQSFSINPGELTEFLQIKVDSAVLNRVMGFDQSFIKGALKANGAVYLINPNGIVISKEGVINTAALVLSTLDVSSDQFFNGHELLFSGESTCLITNYGTIQAFDGDVALIAYQIDNPGDIQALQGTVAAALGQKVLLRPKNDPLLTICTGFERKEIEDVGMDHSGQIEALKVEIQTDGPYAQAINLSGSVDAHHLVKEGGRILLKARESKIDLSGTLKGETVHCESQEAHFHQEALIEAPHGEITIQTSDGLTIEGMLIATEGNIEIHNDLKLLIHTGTIDVSGEVGGKVAITTAKCLNAGEIKADSRQGDGGTIKILTTGPFIETHAALLSAESIEGRGGNIEILVGDGRLFSSGTHRTSSSQNGGGTIHLLGDDIVLAAATIDASGGAGGGEILIGGDYQGKNPKVANASYTYLNHATKVHADSTSVGDGGKVIIWSDQKTECYAEISAASFEKGDGGFIEISSRGELICGAAATAKATYGEAGTVLLDPQFTEINTATGIFPQYRLIDPTPGSTEFGEDVVPLGNGNVVITKPKDNLGGSSAGAVHLYNGLTGALISTLLGSRPNDSVGSGGVVTLTNNNFVVSSPVWNLNAGTADVGAATWVNGTTGLTGNVATTNSLHGSTPNDQVSVPANGLVGGITALTNGHYVVVSPLWDNGGTADVGAATWGNGTTGITGPVTLANSLHGTLASDQVGKEGVVALTNNNYVVASTQWNLTAVITTAGAATWGNGATGTTGPVTSANSLHGTTAGDQVSAASFSGTLTGLTALNNGNYVVSSALWNGNRGAVTPVNGTTGIPLAGGAIGQAVTIGNSLTGSTGGASGDKVGVSRVVVLTTNNNYVVGTSTWSASMGAVTPVNGTTGIPLAGGAVGQVVSTANSLYGTTTGDRIGLQVVPLTNGNYVTASHNWRFWTPTTLNGAATPVNGTTGIPLAGGAIGQPVSMANSLTGSVNSDSVSNSGIIALTNGNYVVSSGNWTFNGGSSRGAATWMNGATGQDIIGTGPGVTISPTNSLVGQLGDRVGNSRSIALTGGNYVVDSRLFPAGGGNVKAATFVNGTTGLPVGTSVNAQTSILGTSSNSLAFISVDDSVNGGSFFVPYENDGSGTVTVGLANPNQMTYARAQDRTLTIQPSFLTDTLNTGTNVQIASNNDTTVSSPITVAAGGNGGALTIRAGRSVLVNANITTDNGNLTLIGNDFLANGVVDAFRDPGAATVTIAGGVTLSAGTGNINLQLLSGVGKTNSASGNLEIGSAIFGASLLTTGNGAINLFAQVNDVAMGSGSLVQSVNGDILVRAGRSIIESSPFTIQAIGTGNLTIVVDDLFPTSPGIGLGVATIPNGTLVSGGLCRIYCATQSVNTLSVIINGAAYVPGTEFVNTNTENWGTYFAAGTGGSPFKIYYKNGTAPSLSSTVISSTPLLRGIASSYVALSEAFSFWRNGINGVYLNQDPYPPALTPKGLNLILPPLVNMPAPPPVSPEEEG